MSEKKNTAVSKMGVFRRVLDYIRPRKGLAALSVLLALVTVALTLYVPVLIGQAVDCLVSAGNVDFARLSLILTRIGVCIALIALAQWFCGLVNNRLTFCTVRDIRRDVFRHLQELPLSVLDARPVGDTVSRMVADVDTFADGLLMGFTNLFTGVMTILGTLGFMVSLSPLIALIVFVLTPLSLFVARFIAVRTYDMFKLQTATRGEQTELIDEAIGNRKLVCAFNREQAIMDEFDEVNGRLEKCSLKATFYSSLVNPSTRCINAMVYASVALVGGLAAINGALTVGTLTSFLSYATQYTRPFNEISGVVTEFQNALACAARIFELLDIPPQSPDRLEAGYPSPVRGAFTIRDVCFSYTPARPLIEDFSLDVRPGERVAMVGPTGCGKTTVVNLLMRFYDIDSGEIRLDGTETRNAPRKALRRQIGMVLQDTWLAPGTIRDNIAFARPDASDEEIAAAAKAAHAHSFIRRLPKGYDTGIDENGGALSQGQKQLLCIARVMLALPPVLILDEATSSIDTRTEQKIQKAFSTMMEGRTSFIVAHRLSTIRTADVILVMRDGKIIEQGRHEELLGRGGFYAKLYHSQFDV